MEMKFYRCELCGQIVAIVKGTKSPLVCCGKPMKEIIAGTVEASKEKHIPVWEQKGNAVYVKIGSAEHPMLPEHYIEWIAIQSEQGNQRKKLEPGSKPEACFRLCCENDKVKAVYAYCNLHGLWKA